MLLVPILIFWTDTRSHFFPSACEMMLAMNAIKKVLVIDDETATLTMFRLFLGAYGYTVLTAENGNRGLRLVHEHHPDIVFTDLKMPGMDGFEVLKAIKKAAPQTEIIVITGHGDMDHVVRALNLDATDFINKPIGRSALEAALRRAEARLKCDQHADCPLRMEITGHMGMVTISGTLSGQHKPELMALPGRIKACGAKGIVIGFDDHAAVNGTGIALLTRLISEAKSAAIPVCIAGLSPNFKTIFDMVGISKIAPCVDTIDEAALAIDKESPT
jgi:CheY-like chemotaxis protein/anti-anti-sigma regulatory factor